MLLREGNAPANAGLQMLLKQLLQLVRGSSGAPGFALASPRQSSPPAG